MVARDDAAVIVLEVFPCDNSVRSFVVVTRGVPSAQIVVLPNANHFVFRSKPVEVLAEMRTFIDRLPPPLNWAAV